MGWEEDKSSLFFFYWSCQQLTSLKREQSVKQRTMATTATTNITIIKSICAYNGNAEQRNVCKKTKQKKTRIPSESKNQLTPTTYK